MIQQIFLYILIFIISAYLLYKIIEKHLISAYYYQKVDHFRKFPIQPGDIVFLGDSSSLDLYTYLDHNGSVLKSTSGRIDDGKALTGTTYLQ